MSSFLFLVLSVSYLILFFFREIDKMATLDGMDQHSDEATINRHPTTNPDSQGNHLAQLTPPISYAIFLFISLITRLAMSFQDVVVRQPTAIENEQLTVQSPTFTPRFLILKFLHTAFLFF